MKKNVLATMDRLEIDDGIRELISQLWKHCYRTTDSCFGHDGKGYVLFSGGDGWFEDNAPKYGLTRVESCGNCMDEFEDEVLRHGLDPNDYVDQRKSCKCGAGVNGNIAYRGILIENPFESDRR